MKKSSVVWYGFFVAAGLLAGCSASADGGSTEEGPQQLSESGRCPAVAAPPADFCSNGEPPTLGKNERGCDTWTCPPVVCPAVEAPTSDFCRPGTRATLEKDRRGCDRWTCKPTNPCDLVKCSSGSSCQLCPAPGKVVPACIPNGASC